jgi:COP9 signalosome complex subunit 1
VLDLYLRGHILGLAEEVRKRSLVQYVSPYQTVDLRHMAAAFSLPLPEVRYWSLSGPRKRVPDRSMCVCVSQLERTLVQLVQDGSIKARIDAERKALVASQADVRAATLDQALTSGHAFTRQSKAALLRINMLRADFVVRPADSTPASAAATTTGEAMAVDPSDR